MPALLAPGIIQKPIFLAPNSLSSPASDRFASRRQVVQIKYPRVIPRSIHHQLSWQTPTRRLFGRHGDSDLSLRHAVFTGDICSHLSNCKPALKLPVASETLFRTGEGEGSHRIGHMTLRKSRCPRAYMDFPYGIPFPEPKKKPEWWWRTLACIPYLMALQISDAGFYFQPLMESYEQFEFLSYYVPGAIRRLPSWFLMVYCFSLYLGVVRNKQWPHFFRYHVMMGLMLENALQIVWHVSNFMPLINFWGKLGMCYWATVGLAFITFLLVCIRCALAGKYVDIPFISSAAFLHTPYSKGDI
ncbi:hypothetical protein SAY86_012645 [Trapa natans]|uniref:Protein TIC 20 n=1 Tax=Trapa natans TaxID=22666 RepID=A0AAN7LX13_TRANT|nr:hypothetical protein SAY86_012645 [Trapa natans]